MIDLHRTLLSAGMSAFVRYYDDLHSYAFHGSRQVFDKLEANGYTHATIKSTVAHAKAIFLAGHQHDALRLIEHNRYVHPTVRERAKAALKRAL